MKPEGAKRHQANRRHGAAAVGQAFAELEDLDGVAALDRNKLVAEGDGSVIQEGIDFQDSLAFCFADMREIIHRGGKGRVNTNGAGSLGISPFAPRSVVTRTWYTIPRRGATHAFREPNATIVAVSSRWNSPEASSDTRPRASWSKKLSKNF